MSDENSEDDELYKVMIAAAVVAVTAIEITCPGDTA